MSLVTNDADEDDDEDDEDADDEDADDPLEISGKGGNFLNSKNLVTRSRERV